LARIPDQSALAKPIMSRNVATVKDCTMIRAVVGDAATAAGLAAFGFVVGSIVYLGTSRRGTISRAARG
jgi:hypothetical protein